MLDNMGEHNDINRVFSQRQGLVKVTLVELAVSAFSQDTSIHIQVKAHPSGLRKIANEELAVASAASNVSDDHFAFASFDFFQQCTTYPPVSQTANGKTFPGRS